MRDERRLDASGVSANGHPSACKAALDKLLGPPSERAVARSTGKRR